jgi:hypothetical protein
VFNVLALDPRLAGSNPAEDNGFLRVMKISSTTSFGREIKPAVKNSCRYEEILRRQNSLPFLAKFILLRY